STPATALMAGTTSRNRATRSLPRRPPRVTPLPLLKAKGVLLPPWDTKPVAAQEDVLSQPSRQKRQPPELRPITTTAARPGPASTCSHTGHRCHFKHHSSRTFGANSKKPGQVLPRGRYRRVGSGEIGGQRDVRPGQWRTRS